MSLEERLSKNATDSEIKEAEIDAHYNFHYNRAINSFKNNNYPAALQSVGRAEKYREASDEMILFTSECLFRMGKYKEAIKRSYLVLPRVKSKLKSIKGNIKLMKEELGKVR